MNKSRYLTEVGIYTAKFNESLQSSTEVDFSIFIFRRAGTCETPEYEIFCSSVNAALE